MTARRLSFIVGIGCVAVLAAAGLAVAQHAGSYRTAKSVGVVTATWIGPATGGLWSDPDNWDTAEFPNNGNGGLNYDVVITSPVNDPAIINLDTDVVIKSLFQRGALDAQSGPANLTINGPWDWQGVILGPGTTRANGGITNPTFTIAIQVIGERIVENAGLATSLKFSLFNGAQFNNLIDGTITLDTGSLSSTNGGVINNFGMLYAESSRSISGVFNNYGLVEVRGSLHLRSSGTHSGEFFVAEGAVLNFEPDTGTNIFTEISNITGLGDVVFDGAEAINLAGGFGLSGLATVRVPALNFTNAPTSPGFSLRIGASFAPPTVVSFEGGLPFLEELTLTSTGTLHIVGDAIVSGAVRWDGTMSGPGTTTTQGPIRAISGLTLDGRTVIAEGGFLWDGSDFALDNGALFQNAEGSTFDINLGSRPTPSIITNTPKNPGRFVNSGIITQTESRLTKIMTDWRQTSTGVMEVYNVSFLGNTDISGSLTRLANGVSPLTFAGPDTGATITHRLNPDSTLIALHAVNVGDPNASGSDIINAEFAGAIDFSDSQASLNVYGANTRLTLVFPTSTGTTAAGPGPPTLTSMTIDNGAEIEIVSSMGACCRDYECFLTSARLCKDGGGSPQPPGSTCLEEDTCDFGVCCFSFGICRKVPERLTASECGDQGGKYVADLTCLQCDIAACCLPNGECDETFVSDCASRGGSWLADDRFCEPDPCGEEKPEVLAFGNMATGDANVLFDVGSAIVSVGTLKVGGTSIVEWVSEQPGDWIVGGYLFRFPGSLTVSNANFIAMDPRPCEWDYGFGVNVEKGATFTLIGPPKDFGKYVECFLGATGTLDSSDPTASATFDRVNLRVGGTNDPGNRFEVSITAQWRNIFMRRQYDSAPPVTTSWSDVDVQEGLEVNGVNLEIDGEFSDAGAQIVIIDGSIAMLPPDGRTYVSRAAFISLDSSAVCVLDPDAFPIAGMAGTAEFLNLFFGGTDPPLATFGAVGDLPMLILGAVGSTDDIVHAVISPGDTRANGPSNPAQAGIGTVTMTARNAVIANGSVLRVDIDPLAVGQRNDRFEIVATTTTFDASLEVSLAPQSACSMTPTDAFTILTGTEITYPSGGDGRRIRTTDGVGSFVVNQSSTGIVLNGYSIAGDGNGDAAVNDADTEGFIPCLSGPGDGVGAECGGYDFDGNGHADLKDFAVLQERFGTACP